MPVGAKGHDWAGHGTVVGLRGGLLGRCRAPRLGARGPRVCGNGPFWTVWKGASWCPGGVGDVVGGVTANFGLAGFAVPLGGHDEGPGPRGRHAAPGCLPDSTIIFALCSLMRCWGAEPARWCTRPLMWKKVRVVDRLVTWWGGAVIQEVGYSRHHQRTNSMH